MNTSKTRMTPKIIAAPSRAKKTVKPQFKSESVEADWHSSAAGREKTHQQFQDAAKGGALRRGTPPAALKAMAAVGRNVSINIRVSAADVQKAHELADEKGAGYQTVFKMLLHEALTQENTRKKGSPDI